MIFKELEKVLGNKSSLNVNFIIQVINSINLEKDAKILDIGTGKGLMAISIASIGYYVITGEPEDHKWADWRTNVKKLKLNHLIEFRPLRAENLPFEDLSFDAIFLYNSFHHIPEKSITFEECIRVLKKKGVLIILELNPRGVEQVRKRHPSHCDAVDPREYSKNFALSEQLIEGPTINAYIFEK
jgi:ubiquinone/menaquinone biosynthesis C-methylase UbiE